MSDKEKIPQQSPLIKVLSKFYEPISLTLFSLVRVLFVKGFEVHNQTATLLFPLLTQRLISLPIKALVLFAWSNIMEYLLSGQLLDIPHLIAFIVMFGLSEYLNKQKKHIFMIILASNLAGLLALEVSGFDLPSEHSKLERIIVWTASESFYTIVFIFINGPLKVYLEIKEGKTSVKKIIEDYEDERNVIHQKMGVKNPDLLP